MATKLQLTHLAHSVFCACWLVTACSESSDIAASGTPDADQAYPPTIFGGTGTGTGATANAAIAATDGASVSPDPAFACIRQTPTPTFCDDFDAAELRDLWDTVTIAHGVPTSSGSLDHNAIDAISAPNSLLAALSSEAQDTDLQNFVTKDFGALSQAPAHFDVEFDLKVEMFDRRPERMLTAFQLAFGILTAQSYGQRSLVIVSDGSHVNLRVAELSLSTDESEPVTTLTNAYPESYLLEQNTWVHVRFESDVTRNVGDRVQLTAAGTRVLDHQMAFAPHALDTRMQLGQTWVDSTDGTQEWRIRFDNVLVHVTPL